MDTTVKTYEFDLLKSGVWEKLTLPDLGKSESLQGWLEKAGYETDPVWVLNVASVYPATRKDLPDWAVYVDFAEWETWLFAASLPDLLSLMNLLVPWEQLEALHGIHDALQLR